MPTYIGNSASSNISVGSQITSGSLTFTAAASKIVPGATSLSLRNNADSADNLIITNAGAATIRAGLTITASGLTVTAGGATITAGDVTVTAGNLIFAAASAKVIPGATSLLFRNNADSSTNITITDAGAVSIARSTLAVSGAITPTGGIAAAGGFSALPHLIHTGGRQAILSTDGTDTTPVVTETYWAQIFVPCNVSGTGISIFNGSATGSGNVTGYIMDSTGTQVATTASTAISGTDAFQRVAWTGGPIALKGPATYFLATQYNNTSSRFNTHLFGDFPAGKVTSTVYGTFASFTPATTFTASLGPYASLY